MTKQQEMSAEEQQSWVRDQYLAATKYIADKGQVVTSVSEQESRYLVPVMAVWKLNLLDKTSVWVITGDLPTDHIVLDDKEEARNVARHFSLKWQLQAENILRNEDKAQAEYANYLVGRAEGLYQIYKTDNLWQS